MTSRIVGFKGLPQSSKAEPQLTPVIPVDAPGELIAKSQSLVQRHLPSGDGHPIHRVQSICQKGGN